MSSREDFKLDVKYVLKYYSLSYSIVKDKDSNDLFFTVDMPHKLNQAYYCVYIDDFKDMIELDKFTLFEEVYEHLIVNEPFLVWSNHEKVLDTK